MGTLVIATKNKGKYLELKKMLGDISFTLLSLEAFPHIEIKETGTSFDENALIKARVTAKETGLPALADDSGLEVNALKGEPGIFTARYAGEHATDEDNIKKLLERLKNVPLDKRQARFMCSLALAFPDGKIFLEHGILEGFIALRPCGIEGFGYDPVFFVPDLGRTLSEISIDEKNRISHRAKALEKMKKHLDMYI